MDVQANQQIGALVYGVLIRQHERASKQHPIVVVDSINGILNSLARATFQDIHGSYHLGQQAFMAQIGLNPVCRFYYMIYTSMVWSSFLYPRQYDQIEQILPVLQEFLEKEAGCGSPSEAEMAILREQLISCMVEPRAPSKLGASGYALYRAATEELGSLPAGNDNAARTRRRKYMRLAFDLCLTVENANLADRKQAGSLIAEALAQELRRSKCKNTQFVLDKYWGKFELFSDGSRLIP